VDIPDDSMERIAFVAVSDQGRWAPTRAQARPSRIRYLARVLMDSGIIERVVEPIQRQILPVGPEGSIG
jgi:hypothetical protein